MKNQLHILITGASRGIGKALAYRYAEEGARLVLLARDTDALKCIADDLQRFHTDVHWTHCDVVNRDDVRSAIAFAVERLGHIDIAILNAGTGAPEWFENFNLDKAKPVFEVNLFGVLHGIEALLPVFRNQGYGALVGVSSLSDVRGFPGSASYCASKAAISTFLESARVQLKPYGIDVITVRPGFITTSLAMKNEFYMPFLMPADKAARIITKGIRKKKSVIQFPRPIVLSTQLIRLLPNWIFDPLSRLARPRRTLLPK